MVNTMVRLTCVRHSAGKNIVAELLFVHDAWMVTPLGWEASRSTQSRMWSTVAGPLFL